MDGTRSSATMVAAVSRIGATVDGKYRLRSLLGVGGMGIVYEAEHLFLGRSVALKIIHPRYADTHDAVTRFLHEARAAGTIGHRAIVQVMDAGFVDGTTPYIVMEKLEGETLADRIVRRNGLRVPQAAMVLRELMRGLGAAHAKGIIHCDLKPANVLLVGRNIDVGTVKILDFGVARIASQQRDRAPEAVMGTQLYMSPEQVKGVAVTPASDLFAAGVVTFEALTGRPPFGGGGKVEVFVHILRDPAPPLVGRREPVPDDLAALVSSLLAKSPDDRPASAGDVVRALDAMGIVSGVGPGASTATRR
ncbi:MAG: serine/threonine protein kinase [Polyangiaceae bacterium]|nr:serine/threonine protein kinase [Polyangiaceae bacterium]